MLLVWGWGELARLRSHDGWMRSSAPADGEDTAPDIAAPLSLIPLLAGRWERAFPKGSHEGPVLSWPLDSSSLCPIPISSFLHRNWGEPWPPSQRAASPPSRQRGGREGKAATQGLYSPAEHEAEGFHSFAALTFAGTAARYETARVGSEASLTYQKTLSCWPEVSNNNSLPFSHGRIASAAALKLSSNPS